MFRRKRIASIVTANMKHQKLTETLLWKITKRIFQCSFLISAVSMHYLACCYSLTIRPGKKFFGQIFFVTKFVVLATIMDYLYLKRMRLTNTLEFLLDQRKKASLFAIKTKVFLILVILCFASYVILGTAQVMELDEDQRQERISVLSFGTCGRMSHGLQTFIMAAESFGYHLAAVVIIMWLPMAYCLTVKIILEELSHLKGMIVNGNKNEFLEQAMQEISSEILKVRKLVKQINNSFSNTVLVWCVCSLFSLAQGITLLQRNFTVNISMIIGNSTLYVPPLVMLVTTILSSKIPSKVQACLELLHSLSESAFQQNLACQLNLLINQLSVPMISMSLGGCYTMNRNFAVSYFGLIVTYSTLVFQLPA